MIVTNLNYSFHPVPKIKQTNKKVVKGIYGANWGKSKLIYTKY